MNKRVKIFLIILGLGLLAYMGYFIYEFFREKDISEKFADIIHLEDRRQINDHLKQYLSDPDPEVRARAALAIGRIGGKGSGHPLLVMLSDESDDVASTAAFALGLTGQKQLAEPMLDASLDLSSGIAQKAVESAGRLIDSSDEEEIDQIIGFLSHPGPQVREAACKALFHAGAKNKVQVLINMIKFEKDELVRRAALYTLACWEANGVDDLYISYMGDPDPFCRTMAVRGLGQSTDPESENFLAIALNDRNQAVVAGAIMALGDKNTSRARQLLLSAIDRDADDNILAVLFDALTVQKNPDAVDQAKSLMKRDRSLDLINSLAGYLTEIEKERAIPMLDSLVRHSPAYTRAFCAKAYAGLSDKNVIPRLALMYNDEDPLVRASVIESFAEFDRANLDFYIDMGMFDRDAMVVSTAIKQIKKFGNREYLPVMNVMIAMGDSLDINIRRSVIDAAGAFLAEDKNDSTACEILLNGMLDREYIVHLDAIELYRDITGEDHSNIPGKVRTMFSAGDIEDAIEDFKNGCFATIVTSRGEIDLLLDFQAAPLTVMNFVKLAKDGYYNGLIIDSVAAGYVIKGGDPRGDGWGGPEYYIRCEYSQEKFERGVAGMATSGKDTGGSRFFITLLPQPQFEAKYTAFAKVVAGMEIVDHLVYGDVIEKIMVQEN